MFKIFTPILGMALLLGGCGQAAAPAASSAKSVFGALDFHLLSSAEVAADRLAKAMGAVMIVLTDPSDTTQSYAFPSCSGVQIGPRQVLTAGHCDHAGLIFNRGRLAAEQDRGKFTMQRFGQVFRAAYTGDMIEASALGEKAAPIAGAAYKNAAMDFAVLAFPYDLGDDYIALGAPLASSRAVNTTPPAVPIAAKIYGYPNGLPLTLAAGCAVSGDAARLYHDCDSLTGSSGGLIATAAGQPLAIQLSGPGNNLPAYFDAHGVYETAEEFAARRGCTRANQTGDSAYAQCLEAVGMNRGLPLSSIGADLRAHASAELVAALGLVN